MSSHSFQPPFDEKTDLGIPGLSSTDEISFRRVSVLIVDDDENIREILREYLSREFTVVTASDGNEAWHCLKNHEIPIDVVLTDFQMPTLSGLELLKLAKQYIPGICVIMISGSADVGSAITAMRSGAFDYITKPILNIQEIGFIIKRWEYQQSLESKLAKYAELYSEVMQNMQVRTFLSIDVLGSLGMKSNEDPFIAQHTFNLYHSFVKRNVVQYNGFIHSTAGDGVMACFQNANEATGAAMTILTELNRFNAEENQLSSAFAVRMGVHTGSVIVAEDSRINTMFSKTLDITGHIQKAATPNAVEVSADTWETLKEQENYMLLDRTVDNLVLYRWVVRTD